MNKDFPRILSLLRKERHLSQKQVAADLGITQALLSHYEKGKRECGLDFLVRAADYYQVSTDYLLGRSPVSSGSFIVESEIPDGDSTEKTQDPSHFSALLTKKLIINSVDIIYSLLSRVGNRTLTRWVSEVLCLAVYRAFRLTYMSNPKNEKNIFGIKEEIAFYSADAATSLAQGNAELAIKESESSFVITTAVLEQEYGKKAAALLNLIKNSENSIQKML